MQKIKVEHLTKVFGPHPEQALRMLDQGVGNADIRKAGHAVGIADVSFDVEEGELLVIMGLSGSGKSTLLRCLNCLNPSSRGSIFIDGEDITRFDHEQLLDLRRRKISMVFQHFALFPHRSVADNAAYGLEVQGVDAAERRQRALEALELVGLKGWEDSRPGQLSGGMQQRVGLARALAVKSDILLMDEAFSALDPLIRRDMQQELASLQRRMKKTIVFITHDLDEALQIGDRIVLMKDGRVVQIGTPEDILNNPANAYVERFVENVDMSRVLTARTVMGRAREVAFPQDGPRTVLHKMTEGSDTSMLVVERDHTLVGTVTLDELGKAVQDGRKSIAELIQHDAPTIAPDTPLTDIINLMATWPYRLPVVDEQRKLLGVVTRPRVINALAQSSANHPADAAPESDERSANA
ncbi:MULTISPECIES: quaternary amine ABC transporter ATP-binding protein [Rhodanobacter]|uniref:Quaternary amine transport ATP-binding protein n=1 Tax=Rhodanobacter glycinis TaxID=582702 RepID=A0A1I4FGM5_9GAMM|nr:MULTISPECIES: glycine betaine/L-proline ABC transporter ATP-binding protein [Rhodanobacter]EIL89411.1 glycine betaine/L-proline ABC transporter ATPase [Rhodanobacter sp. 115]SFL15966.1 glycine betaine/proline transport system ATP-binding protein [Rhodanobacter glycinis]